MAYHYENIKLEKGMYGRSGRSFSQTLEELDPSEHYRGTPLEGMDAFQRQLKRFDIKVKGVGSDCVEKFFHNTESAVLFPEFVSRVVRQGMEEESILADITATVTRFDGMDYRSIASVPTEEQKALKRVEEGAEIPQTRIRTQENLVRLHKRGRMLVASYEAIRFQRLDLFAVTLRQIGAYIGRMHLEDAIRVLCDGDGNKNPAQVLQVGTKPISGTAGTLSYEALVDFWSQFDPYTMNTLLVSSDMMLAMLKLSEFQNPLTGLNFQGTGTLTTPLGAKLLRTSSSAWTRTTPWSRSAPARSPWSTTSSSTVSWSVRPSPPSPASPSCSATLPRYSRSEKIDEAGWGGRAASAMERERGMEDAGEDPGSGPGGIWGRGRTPGVVGDAVRGGRNCLACPPPRWRDGGRLPGQLLLRGGFYRSGGSGGRTRRRNIRLYRGRGLCKGLRRRGERGQGGGAAADGGTADGTLC